MTIIMIQVVTWSILLYFSLVPPASGQAIVLPQGDSEFRKTQEDPAPQEAARDSRLKQQGQGPNRVEGTPQPGASGETEAGDRNNLGRQDTGLSDPTVNSGQASGMQSVQGRIVNSDGDTYTVRQLSGPDTKLTIDRYTAGDKKLVPGDVVTGLVTAQGRVVVIHKEVSAKR